MREYGNNAFERFKDEIKGADSYKVLMHFESDADKQTLLTLLSKWGEGLLGDDVDEPEASFSVTTETIKGVK